MLLKLIFSLEKLLIQQCDTIGEALDEGVDVIDHAAIEQFV